ncbi:MAG TPA: flagellar basal body P-ring protein FlgI [Syntrophorhabdaceae bacterium]|nr:flagellar basal body P-ring protein FlgI [Syntrophorhabdaceae bacterium]
MKHNEWNSEERRPIADTVYGARSGKETSAGENGSEEWKCEEDKDIIVEGDGSLCPVVSHDCETKAGLKTRGTEERKPQRATGTLVLDAATKSRIIARVFHVFALVCIYLVCLAATPYAARIKDLAYVNGVRTNQLVGYGLVTGLRGTGDKANTIFTTQSLANMLENMGVRVDPTAIKVNNIAAVVVTANLPPFAKIGNRIDVTVSSIGDARSIEGGVLLITQLKGADGEVYGVAQGPVVVGGFLASGQGATVQKNHPTVGRIANGATIEREVEYGNFKMDSTTLSLKMPDFTTAKRVADRINEVFAEAAFAKDGGTVTVETPQSLKANPVKFLSAVENLEVAPDVAAKIIVDEKTGTVVIGENVKISTVAIAHGNLSVQIKESEKVSQPLPFTQGQTVVTPDTTMKVEEEKGKFYLMESGVTIRELVNALNATGVSSRDVITILQTIKASGALQAELEVI